MGRTLVRILNLGYLAAAAVSIWSLVKKPIFKTTVNVDMTPEKLGEVLAPLFESTSKSSPRISMTRDSEKKITDYITPERIADSFRDEDPEKNGFHLSIPVTIPAKYAFDLKNQHIIQEVVVDNITSIIKGACETLSNPLTKFVFSITEEFAISALEDAINAQIQNATDGGSPITTEEVVEIYQNVYDALSTNEGSIPLSDLTDVIIHGKDGEGTSALTILNKNPRYDHALCDPQPTEEQYLSNPDEFFVLDENGKYVHPEAYDSDATYYSYVYVECDPQPTEEAFNTDKTYYFVFDSEIGLYKNIETFDGEATYFVRKDNPYTEEDLDRVDIEGQMEQALKEVPGLVENSYTEATGLTAEAFNATLKSTKYYITDETSYLPAPYPFELDGNYFVKEDDSFVSAPDAVLDFNQTLLSNTYFILDNETYVEAGYPYSEETTYYTCEATINDIDTALVALINQYLLKQGESGGEGKAILRTRSGELTNAKSKDELNAALTEFALKYIPLESVSSVDDSAGKYVPFALLGLVVIVGFPWALLGLVTLIRTFRKRKCWTKPWVVIVFGFPQLIFGIIVTYGTKYALEIAGESLPIVKQLLEAGLTIEMSTLCLIPSFVYLAVVAYSIVYTIFAHSAKVQYRLEKRARKSQYYDPRRY